jgi:hypothetical protein
MDDMQCITGASGWCALCSGQIIRAMKEHMTYIRPRGRGDIPLPPPVPDPLPPPRLPPDPPPTIPKPATPDPPLPPVEE